MFGFRTFGQSAGPVRRLATVIALILAASFYLTLFMNRSVNLTDEGLVLFGAERVLNGDIPHRDFFTLYGPGQFYLLAALFKLFGSSVLVERAWDTAVRCLSVVLVFVIVNQAAPRRAALLAAAASLVWLASFEYYGYSVFPALAATLGGLAFLVPALARPNPTPWLVPAGACAGLVVMFRYDVGVAVFGSECALLAFAAWSHGVTATHGLRTAVQSLLLLSAGFSIVVVPVVVAFALNGVIPDLVFDFVAYSAQTYVNMRSLPFPGPSSLPTHPSSFAVYLPLLLCAAAIPTVIDIVRCRRGNASTSTRIGSQPSSRDVLPWMIVSLVVLTLVLFGKGVVRVATVHMSMALIMSLALAGVLAQPMRGRGLVRRGTMVAAVLVTGIFTLNSTRPGLDQALGNIAWASDPASWELPAGGTAPKPGSCRVPAGLTRLACFRVSPAEMETILYVEQQTTPDDPVFSGVSRHDRIFANDILLYFATNRRSVTKWHEYDPGLQTTALIQEKMVRELLQGRPKLIVLESTWENVREPNGSALSSGVTILDDHLRRAYEPVATFGPNTVLRTRLTAQP